MSDAAGVSLGQIGQIAVPIRDLDRSLVFYRDVLGLRFLFRAPPDLAFFDCAGVRLMLDGPARDRAGQSSIIYFKVDDLPRTHTTLAARGVNFEGPPHLIAKLPDHDLWMAFFQDPDGNMLALMSEVRQPQAPSA